MRVIYGSAIGSMFGLALSSTLFLSSAAQASEVSLLSGFYRSQEDTPGFKQRTISLGGRYGLTSSEPKQFWFIDARISSTSFSGDGAPSGASGLQLGAGQKYFFRKFGKSIHTFLAWSAGVISESSATANSETKSSGLYYAGNGGFRFEFTPSIFMDLEAEFFQSSLVGNTETKSIPAGTTTKSKVTELQVDTFSGAESLQFGVGMIF